MNNYQLDHNEYKHEKRKFPIYIVLDNVEDKVNIGSIFRIADAFGVSKIYICGNDNEVVDIQDGIIDITKNTTKGDFLGYTIYTSRDENNEKILKITLDNYDKSYLKEYAKEAQLDFKDSNVDNDGKLELVTTQNILYSLEDSTQTIGKVEITFSIEDKKLTFKSVEVKI